MLRYLAGRLLRAVPVRENLLLAPVENVVKVALVLLCIGLGALSGATPDRLGWTLDNGWRDLGLGIILGPMAWIMGNNAPAVTADMVKKMRDETKDRKEQWTWPEIQKLPPENLTAAPAPGG